MRTSILTVTGTAPPVVLSGLTLQNSELGPAVVVHGGGRLLMHECMLTRNPQTALVTSGDSVEVTKSTFSLNGDRGVDGGAVRVSGGRLELSYCTFNANIARRGGAMFASGSGHYWLRRATFSSNIADLHGGAIYATGADVTLANSTLLIDNVASGSGGSFSLDAGAKIRYALPAPVGRWVGTPVKCTAVVDEQSQPCDAQHLGYTVWELQFTFNEDLPYKCAPGLIGSSEVDEASQVSPLCGGACPSGRFCEAGTQEPAECIKGAWCPSGTPNPIPCSLGTYSASPGMASISMCTPCPAGTFCGLGSYEPIACPIATYNAQPNSARCTECPAGTTTAGTGATRLEDCVCRVDQYDRDAATNTTQCVECPFVSTDCKAVGAGVTLETLPLAPGFWRSYKRAERFIGGPGPADTAETISERLDEVAESRRLEGESSDEDAAQIDEEDAPVAVVWQCFAADYCIGGSDCQGNSTKGTLCDGYCAEHHHGPYCALCVDGYILSGEGCTKCEGNAIATFAVPLAVVVVFLLAAIYACRLGIMTAVTNEVMNAAFEVGKAGEAGDSILTDAIDAAVDQTLQGDETPAAASSLPPSLPPSPPPYETGLGSSSSDVEGTTASSPSQLAVTVSSVTVASGRGGWSPSKFVRRHSLRRRSIEAARSTGRKAKWLARRAVSLQVKFRILVSLVQVVSQLGVIFAIPYPPFYDDLVSILGVFSLDIIEFMPIGCLITLNHDHFLLMRTLIPIAPLLISLVWRRFVSKQLAETILTLNFLLLYLLFPSNSSNIFATFQCDTFFEHPDQPSYLRIDLSVDCNAPFHRAMMGYAGLMIVLYPVGIPALYAYLLYWRYGKEVKLLQSLEIERLALRDTLQATKKLASAREGVSNKRDTAQDSGCWRSFRHPALVWTADELSEARGAHGDAASASHETSVRSTATQEDTDVQIVRLQHEQEKLLAKLPNYVQKLVLGYELRTFYFELLESARKLALVCLPVFFQPSGSVAQLIFGLVVCFFTFGGLMLYHPYVDPADDRLAQLCQVQIFFALLSSIALKYDTATLFNSTNIDILLSAITFLPLTLAVFLETPLAELCYPEARDKKLGEITRMRAKLRSFMSAIQRCCFSKHVTLYSSTVSLPHQVVLQAAPGVAIMGGGGEEGEEGEELAAADAELRVLREQHRESNKAEDTWI